MKEVIVYKQFYEVVLMCIFPMLIFSEETFKIGYSLTNTMLSEYMYFITPFI